MKLSEEEVRHLADLAHLELADDEIVRYRDQMSSILDYVGKISELESAEAALTGTDAVNVTREDEVRDCPSSERDAIVAGFPARRGDSLEVPGVFAGRGEAAEAE